MNFLYRTSKKKHISILLGSGFSVPDGLPTTSKINERLKTIKQNEIAIHSSGVAWFLNGNVDPNSWSREEEKLFVQRFLEFYNRIIIQNQQFNYEKFYDFYNELRRTDVLDKESQKFFEDYRKESGQDYDHPNLLLNFHQTFSQLLASLLNIRWPVPIQWGRPYRKNYAEYLELLEELGKNYKVHIHSLNHDMLMEYLFHTDTLAGNISDGFEELGSPFYGDFISFDNKNNPKAEYTVRLRRFVNEYSHNYCFYKLHGSIDQYVFNYENKKYTTIKLPQDVGSDSLTKEIRKKNKLIYYPDRNHVYPDFLSGTSTKILNYDRQVYYKPIFKHFISNLKKSKYLIVIGYSFGDSKINEIIEKYFLNKQQNVLIDIDIKIPEMIKELKYKVRIFNKSISEIDHTVIMKDIR